MSVIGNALKAQDLPYYADVCNGTQTDYTLPWAPGYAAFGN